MSDRNKYTPRSPYSVHVTHSCLTSMNAYQAVILRRVDSNATVQIANSSIVI